MKFKLKHARLWMRRLFGRGSPESIARGAALGLFIGFFVVISVQTPIAVALAFLFRAQRLAAVAFTFVTNPFTVFVIYPVQCMFGGKLLGYELNVQVVESKLKSVDLSWHGLLESSSLIGKLGVEIVTSFMVGGAIFGIVSAAIGYPIVLFTVRKLQEKRARMHVARLLKKQKKETEVNV